MAGQDREKLIAEETFMILHSGEIPEIAYHGSLFYLREDPDGPGLELDHNELLALKQAVVGRYRTIILRDLNPENRDRSIYRGLARCLANWQRLVKFCAREGLKVGAIRPEAAEALQKFLRQEVTDVEGGKRAPSLNCSQSEVALLAEFLGVTPAVLPDGWEDLCPEGEE